MGLFAWLGRVNERYIKKLPEPIKELAISKFKEHNPELFGLIDRLSIEAIDLQKAMLKLPMSPEVQTALGKWAILKQTCSALYDKAVK